MQLNSAPSINGLSYWINQTGAPITPQGRISFSSGVRVHSTTVSAQGTIYYGPYAGPHVPIYNGTGWHNVFMTAELSNIAANAATGNAGPAAVAASKVYDLFVWESSAGVLTLTRSPAWTNDTTRGFNAPSFQDGIPLNTDAITNGPAALRGTWVSTVRSNGSSTFDFIFGGSAAGGTAAFFGLWNVHNRRIVTTTVTDSNATWTQSSATVGALDAGGTGSGLNNRATFVSGIAEDSILASLMTCIFPATSAGANGAAGLVLDATNAFDKRGFVESQAASQMAASVTVTNTYAPQLGAHFIQAVQAGDGSTTTLFTGGNTQGLTVTLML